MSMGTGTRERPAEREGVGKRHVTLYDMEHKVGSARTLGDAIAVRGTN